MRIHRRKTPPRSFFKIILPFNLIHHKLRIPKDFAKVYRNELSTSAKLTVPSGQIWDVGLEKGEKSVWFYDGWKEFAEHHSIGCWFFLTFDYVGTSTFDVHIYNLSCVEITYPTNQSKQCLVSDKGKSQGGESVKETYSSRSKELTISSRNQVFYKCIKLETSGKRCYGTFLKNSLSDFAPEFSERIKKNGLHFSSMDSLRSDTRYFTRSKQHKVDDEGKRIKFESMTISRKRKVRACEVPDSQRLLLSDKPDQNKWNEMQILENLQTASPLIQCNSKNNHCIIPAKDCLHETKVSGPMELAIQSEDEEQQTLKSQKEVDLCVSRYTRQLGKSPGEDKYSSNEGGIFKLENPPFTVILEPYLAKYLYESFWAHISIGAKYLSCFTMYLPLEFNTKYLHFTSKAIVPLASGGKQWEVILEKERHKTNLQKFNVHEYDSANLETKYGQNQYLLFNINRRLGEESAKMLCSSSTSRLSPISSENEVLQECIYPQSGKRCYNSFSQNSSEFAPEFSHRVNKHDAIFSSTEQLRSNNHYFTRSKRRKLDDEKKTSGGGKVRVCEMPNSRISSLLDKPGKNKRKQTKNIENSHSAKDGSSPSEASHCIESAKTLNEVEKQPEVTNEEVQLPVPKVSTKKSGKSAESYKEISEPMMFETENPAFTVVMKPHHVRYCFLMYLPIEFSRKHLHITSKTRIHLVSGGKEWEVVVKYSTSHYLSGGWSTFVRDHGLMEGDVCVFELVEVKNVVLKVSIFRAHEDDEQPTIRSEVESPVPKALTRKSGKSAGRYKAISEAMMLKTENPAFTVIMKPYQVRYCFKMYMPIEFSRKHLHITSKTRIHLIFGGKKWEVIVASHHLSGGWSTFVRDNGLMEGDVCVFELVEVKNIVLKVSIFRSNEGSGKTNLQK